MSQIQYFTEEEEYARFFGRICQLIIVTSASLLTFLVLVWGMYFACRAREFGKKVYYLKKQTDERCQEELDIVNEANFSAVVLFDRDGTCVGTDDKRE